MDPSPCASEIYCWGQRLYSPCRDVHARPTLSLSKMRTDNHEWHNRLANDQRSSTLARWLRSELRSDGGRGLTVARRTCLFRAEGVGFEPTGTLRLQRFSRPQRARSGSRFTQRFGPPRPCSSRVIPSRWLYSLRRSTASEKESDARGARACLGDAHTRSTYFGMYNGCEVTEVAR